MKKIIALLVIVISFVNVCNSQINTLKNLKDKTTDKNKTNSDNNSDKKDGSPEYDPENPIYISYSIVRDEISSTKNILKDAEWTKNVEGRNEDALKYLAKAKENLEKLKSDAIESKKPYVKNFEKEYDNTEAERKSKYDSYLTDKEYDKKLDAYYNFAILGWDIQDKSLEPSYTGYYKLRKDFETQRPEKFKNEYVQKRVGAIDNFFKVEVYKVVPELNATVDKIIAEMHTKNSSGDEDYLLNAKSYLKDFEEPINSIIYNKKYLLEDKTGIDAVQTKIDKEKTLLDEYIKSGKYDAHVAKFHQALIDAVKLGTKKMSNSKYESMVTKGVDKGKVLRVVITSDVWMVKKNEWGFPLYKYLGVDIAVNYENKCWLSYGQIKKNYEGGGIYGDEFFDYWGLQDEMNCNNINK